MLRRIELHCHLDGSVRPATIAELMLETGIRLPRLARELDVPRENVGLARYIACIDAILPLLQTEFALRRVARELVHDWANDGVILGEARFAPQLHTAGGLSTQRVLRAVADGLLEGSTETGVHTGLIVCFLRHQDPRTSLAIADLAAEHTDVVVGVDLAGDEAYPLDPHVPAFDIARQAGLPITIHAGEAAGPASVRQAMDDVGAARIGHGVRAAQSPELVNRLAAADIVLETCPTSNVQTNAVRSMTNHPVRDLLRRGVRVTVSTDARTISATTLAREQRILQDALNWTIDDECAARRNALHGAFIAPELRQEIDTFGRLDERNSTRA